MPIVIPDLTTVTLSEVKAVTLAAALVSGQAVLDTWDSMEVVRDGSLAKGDGGAPEIDFASEYQLLTTDNFVVDVGGQSLTLGTVSALLLSVRHEIEGDRLIARPLRNNTVQKNFTPLPDAAGPLQRRVLGRIVGRVEDSSSPTPTA